MRSEGNKLYKILGVVYSKDEMNGQVFHHDDLDDICASSSWVEKFFGVIDSID